MNRYASIEFHIIDHLQSLLGITPIVLPQQRINQLLRFGSQLLRPLAVMPTGNTLWVRVCIVDCNVRAAM